MTCHDKLHSLPPHLRAMAEMFVDYLHEVSMALDFTKITSANANLQAVTPAVVAALTKPPTDDSADQATVDGFAASVQAAADALKAAVTPVPAAAPAPVTDQTAPAAS